MIEFHVYDVYFTLYNIEFKKIINKHHIVLSNQFEKL